MSKIKSDGSYKAKFSKNGLIVYQSLDDMISEAELLGYDGGVYLADCYCACENVPSSLHDGSESMDIGEWLDLLAA